jgi:uncharacterized protein with HEPN domain
MPLIRERPGQSEPNEYKIEIIGEDPARIHKVIPELGEDTTWATLHEKRF